MPEMTDYSCLECGPGEEETQPITTIIECPPRVGHYVVKTIQRKAGSCLCLQELPVALKGQGSYCRVADERRCTMQTQSLLCHLGVALSILFKFFEPLNFLL